MKDIITKTFLEALGENNSKVIEELLSAGMDPQYRPEIAKGSSPDIITLAAMSRNLTITKLLLEAVEANIKRSSNSKTKLLVRKKHQEVEYGRLLLTVLSDYYHVKDWVVKICDKLEISNPITKAEKIRNQRLDFEKMEIIQFLIDSGANVNPPHFNSSPLMEAAISREDNREVIKLLIQVGADLNYHDTCGDTPLLGAIKQGNVSHAKLLINAGADINITDKAGNKALIYAICHDQKEIVELLKSVQEKN